MTTSFSIAHIVPTFPPYKGGIGNVCYQTALALYRAGVTVDVYTQRLNGQTQDTAPYPVHRLWSIVRFGNAAWLPQLLWKVLKYDVVHLHYPFIGSEAIFLAKLLRPKLRIIIWYHMDLHGRGVFYPIFRVYQAVMTPIITHLAETIVFSSYEYGRTSRLSMFFFKHPDRCQELGYGVDTEVFTPNNSTVRENATMARVLFVAALDSAHYFKGLVPLLNAIVLLPALHLDVVGDGNLRPWYEEQAKLLGVGDRVRFLGRLSDGALAEEYQTSDVFVLPSIDRSEAFGLVLLEAQSSGLPVVASRLPGVSTLVRENVDGLLVTPGDVEDIRQALQWMKDHAEERRAMGRAGREKVIQYYRWSDVAKFFIQLYHIHPDHVDNMQGIHEE